MTVNVALGHVSNAFLIAALVIYSLSVVAFAGDFGLARFTNSYGGRRAASNAFDVRSIRTLPARRKTESGFW